MTDTRPHEVTRALYRTFSDEVLAALACAFQKDLDAAASTGSLTPTAEAFVVDRLGIIAAEQQARIRRRRVESEV